MKLVVRKYGDRYVIERSEPPPYKPVFHGPLDICDARVEGTGRQMLAIAEAIEQRSLVTFEQCAVAFMFGMMEFWNPQESEFHAIATTEEADELATLIRKEITSNAPET
jgi:hypothetical protein